MAELMRFEIVHRPDLKTHFFAEVWCARAFFWRMLSDSQARPCELKGDERRIGCRFKLDVLIPCWGGWEGTSEDVPLVWMVQAASEAELEGARPAAQLWPIKRGVNIMRWIAEEGESPPAPSPQPGEPGTPTPGPNPTPQPSPGTPVGDLPAFDDWLDNVVVVAFSAANVVRPMAVLWGDRELVYQVPADWLAELRGMALSLAERVQGVRIVRKERG